MIVVAGSNGVVGIKEAVRVLRDSGSAVDAVEAGIRLVESNPKDHSAGYGGFPNLLGEVELDASIMDGRTLAAGAVGALRGYTNAISVARKVMDILPHVFLVGDGATRFAREMGFAPCDLLVEDSRRVWLERLQRDLPPKALDSLSDRSDLWKWVEIASDPEKARGTVNFLAQDASGNICAGASTSGWAWKYPGRLGDSPVIGAGTYADSRYGAAACSGMGEMAIRACTAHSIVLYLRMGMSVEGAGKQAMIDLKDLEGAYLGVMNALVLDHEGNHTGFSSTYGSTYVYMTVDMSEPVHASRRVVPVRGRWVRSHVAPLDNPS